MLRCVKVRKAYGARDSVVALNGVTLELTEGHCTAITGRSGSGKSTLLHILGGLLTPSSGTVLIDDSEIYSLPHRDRIHFRRTRIGFLFQDSCLVPHLTAAENVMVALMLRGIEARRQHGIAALLLDEAGLTDRTTHLPAQLSTGERQRAAFARAIAGSPPLLLCDEPTGNLDPENAAKIIAILKRYAARGATVVMVTHDPKVAAQADSRYRLESGSLLAQ